ncbi:hypothetical protein ACJIZ3_013920 [Penstemon smallii]|uniref:SRP54-type proteins GTP-binding domain-containing protein n=1 Tax=Penstemon smallii TaxID=265156 RepID=A0ABD3RHZ8_9LAMI
MLEQLLIFSRGGLILWAYKEHGNALKGSPIDALITSVLLEERSGADSYNYDAPGASYTLKWTFHNELGLVFVAVYHRILHLLYVDDLLSMVKQEFSEIYDPKKTSYNDFDDIFQQLKMDAEARAEEIKKSNQVRKPVNSGRKQNGSEDTDVGSKKKTGDQDGGDDINLAEVPLFEKGYEKDPAMVAKEAIQEASRNGSDVVLVDTAGRKQDNEPLMRALSKLIYVNNPDLILFVGEAIVGTDAVDQLSKFNQKLGDLSPSPNPRLIDGTLLTKFDVDDVMVGAVLSMAYISGAPVVFVGCGQYYPDLKKLNVKSIVKTLLS